MNGADIVALVKRTQMVDVINDDRVEFCRALILQGYEPERAGNLASTLPGHDGALQMLARHRLRYSTQVA